jgi:hypothetical protein
MKNLEFDNKTVLDMMQDTADRKRKLAEKIESATVGIKNDAKEVRDALEIAKKKMVTVFNHKEKVEDQAEFLIEDRKSGGKN